jgi:hypothetical protein
MMSWTVWYVQAILHMARTDAKDLLTRLLVEPEYEEDAAWGLFQVARTDAPSPTIWPRNWPMRNKDLDFVWRARAGESEIGFSRSLRSEVATILRDRIAAIQAERAAAEYPEDFDGRLRILANVLAEIDGRNSADLILEITAIPGSGKYLYSGWSRINALEALLMQGVVLPAAKTWEILEPVMQHAKEHRWNNQELGPLTKALCIGLFTDDPQSGIARVRACLDEKLVSFDGLRSLMKALGSSRIEEAAELLADIVADTARAQYVGDEWIQALKRLDTPAARELLLSFVDPSLPAMPTQLISHYDGRLIDCLVGLAQRDSGIRQRMHSLVDTDLSAAQANILGKVLAKMGTLESLLRALDLLKDDGSGGSSYELYKELEEFFVEHRALQESSNTYTMVPRASNEIRLKLLNMVQNDPLRKKSAWALLNVIEKWRMQFGRPDGEPRSPSVEAGFFWPLENEPN